MNSKLFVHAFHAWHIGGVTLVGAVIGLYRQDFPWEGNWMSLHDVVFQGRKITYVLTVTTYKIDLWHLLGWVALGAIVAMIVEGLSK
jgi:hypothetical protein